MDQFDPLFFNMFDHYKPIYKTKANDIALWYICLLQGTILLLFGTFFGLFLSQMNVDVMSESKAWILFGIVMLILTFRNWMYYSGKKRKLLNVKINKMKLKDTKIWMLWLFPFACLAFSIILYQQI